MDLPTLPWSSFEPMKTTAIRLLCRRLRTSTGYVSLTKSWAARCSRSESAERFDAWSSCVRSCATRDSSSVFLAWSRRPRSAMPTPTRIPITSARKTAVSEAT